MKRFRDALARRLDETAAAAQQNIPSENLRNQISTAQLPPTGNTGTGYTPGDDSVATDKIQDGAVTFPKVQDITSDRLLGRDTAGTGDVEQLTVGGGVEFSGAGGIQRSALTGDVTAGAGSNATTIANDAVSYAKIQNVSAASKLLGRGDSGAGDPQEITLGSGLSMSGTTLSAPGGGSSLTIEEVDGTPSEAAPTKLIFPNGTLSVASNEVTYTPAGGSGNSSSTGAVGSEPGSPATGDLYLENNGAAIERYSGSAWARWGPIYQLTAPPTSGWSWINQGSASVDTTNGGIYIVEPGRTSGTNFRCYVRTAPSAPYTITVYLKGCIFAKNYLTFGLLWRQSSDGKCVFVYEQYNSGSNQDNARFGVDKFNSPSSFNSEYRSHGIPELIPWLRIADDNTNRIVSYSPDGQHWSQYHSVGRTDFLTADQVGIFVSGENAATPNLDASALLLSWKEA